MRALGIDPSFIVRSPIEVGRDLFESEALIAGLLRITHSWNGFPPDLNGAGLTFLIGLIGMIECGGAYGGTHTSAHAAYKCFIEAGGKSFAQSEVAKILVENGKATGIRLVDGTEIAVKKDGTLLGVDSTFLDNGGVYLSYGGITTFLHGAPQGGPYRLPSMRFLGIRVCTNRPTSGGMRGHGAIQCRWPWELMMNTIAEKLGIDPLEIRRKNGLQKGDVTVNALVIRSSGHVECIDRSSEAIGWDQKWKKSPPNHGVGLGSNFFCSGAGFSFFFDHPATHSAVTMEAHEDGGIVLSTGVADIGQGCETTLAQIAAEELGVRFTDIHVVAGDTSATTVDFGSGRRRVGGQSG